MRNFCVAQRMSVCSGLGVNESNYISPQYGWFSGLVARYYLEVLEGWLKCKALVTLGTPYRGSVDAVNFVANGYKQIFLELTDVVRSFTSVYQLMPIYEIINVGGKYQRVAETDGIPNLDKKLAEKGLAFHREIEDAVNQHRKNNQYLTSGYKIIPIVGFRQSAKLSEGKLTASYELPNGFDSSLTEGDGTVPRFSAIPIELDQEYRETYIAQKHSYLHSTQDVLGDLCERLKQMQNTREPIRVPELSTKVAQRTAISLNLDDLYLANEPVELRARILNPSIRTGVLQACITPANMDGQELKLDFQQQQDDKWVLTIDDLASGLYRLKVQTSMRGSSTPIPVQDVFEVTK
jgi:hypothetical protein